MQERLAKMYDSLVYGYLGDILIIVGSLSTSIGLMYIAMCPKCKMIKG